MNLQTRLGRWMTPLASLVLMTLMSTPALAQAPASGRQAAPSLVPLKVTVLIAYYDGETRTMNLPFVLHVNANGDNTSVRMGSLIALPRGFDDAGRVQYNYQNVGTNIDLEAKNAAADQFLLDVTVNDTSVADAGDGEERAGRGPTIRTFTANNSLLMRDGETVEYTTAADKATGQTVRVSVTLEVIG